MISTTSAGVQHGRIAFSPDSIPYELRQRPQWVVWRYGAARKGGKRAKEPLNARTGRPASVSDPTTWNSFRASLEACGRLDLDGVGFVFSPCDPFFGVDFDACFDPDAGELVGWADDLVAGFATYTEISPSGAGVKLIGRGRLPGPGRHGERVELYDRGRYFALTGRLLPGAPPEIREASAAAANLYRFLDEARTPPTDAADPPVPADSPTLNDDDLIGRAGRARNGAKFLRLWSGDWSGYPSQSEGDLALCSLLAFWCGPDPSRVVALFSRSGLMRVKWRRRDYSLRLTAARAVRTRAVYWPGPRPASPLRGDYRSPSPPLC